MKKAVIQISGKQYLVSEGDTLSVDYMKTDKKSLEVKPNLLIENDGVSVGKPLLDSATVKIEITNPETRGEKVLAIRYKAKKRVRTVRGHRQKLSDIKIVKIS